MKWTEKSVARSAATVAAVWLLAGPGCSGLDQGTAGSGGSVASDCAGAEEMCGAVCIDTSFDFSNCGTCGSSCLDGERCLDGVCACDLGRTVCASGCIDTSANFAHCGGCDQPCQDGEACVQGSCESAPQGTGGSPSGGAGSGGTSSGGASSGGAAVGGNGPTGGSPLVGGTGGADASGGASTGAASGVGGTATGGMASGGAATGGADSGGTGGGDNPPGTGVSIVDRELYLDGERFRVRGVNWNPVPKGGSHPNDLDFAGFADQDIALMQAAGINAVRTYERIEDVAVLDKLYAAGIYVFSTVYGWWQDDPSVVTARVNAVKDHPAILVWVLGNEWNYNQLYADGQITNEQARDQINQAAAAIKAVDSTHPVATIYGEFSGLSQMVSNMPDIDIWGINSYRGLSHGDLFTTWEGIAAKPMFLGEYGADAYNANTASYDPSSQAQATAALTEEIMANYVSDQGGSTVGGFIFEWADEWWKDGAGSAATQDVGGIAPGGGPFPDQTFNEEWWGIVDIDRQPRPAYDELKQLYAP